MPIRTGCVLAVAAASLFGCAAPKLTARETSPTIVVDSVLETGQWPTFWVVIRAADPDHASPTKVEELAYAIRRHPGEYLVAERGRLVRGKRPEWACADGVPIWRDQEGWCFRVPVVWTDRQRIAAPPDPE
jgi:hypothetical protein